MTNVSNNYTLPLALTHVQEITNFNEACVYFPEDQNAPIMGDFTRQYLMKALGGDLYEVIAPKSTFAAILDWVAAIGGYGGNVLQPNQISAMLNSNQQKLSVYFPSGKTDESLTFLLDVCDVYRGRVLGRDPRTKEEAPDGVIYQPFQW